MADILFHIISGVLGIFLAAKFVPGVEFYGTIKMLFVIGGLLGLVNFFVKPLLKAITLPLRIITLGIFSWIINMFVIWLVADVLFPQEMEIHGLLALFWTTLIVWVLNFFFGLRNGKK